MAIAFFKVSSEVAENILVEISSSFIPKFLITLLELILEWLQNCSMVIKINICYFKDQMHIHL